MKGKKDAHELVFGIDDPLENPNDDCLDRSLFAKRIFETIKGTPLYTNTTIGIHGAWGSGKTTTMNFLRFYCKKAGHPVALYNPWQFYERKEAWEGFISSIDKGIAEWQGKKIGNLKRKCFLKKASEKVRELTAATEVGKIAGSLILAPLEGLLEQTKQRVQKELNKALNDKRLFIFIDDLDRSEPDILYELLMLLNEIVNFKRCIYIIGLDVNVASQIIKRKTGNEGGNDFLDKIINWQFQLPIPTDFEWQELLDKETNNLNDNIQKNSLQLIFPYLPRNPRKFKHFLRYINALHKSFLNRFDIDELNWKLLYLAQLLKIEFPEVFDKIITTKELMDGIPSNFFMPEEESAKTLKWADEISKDVAKNKKERLSTLWQGLRESVGFIDQEELKKHLLVVENHELLTWKEYNAFKKTLLLLADNETRKKIDTFVKEATKSKQIERVREFIKMLFVDRDKILSRVADAPDQEEMEQLLNDVKDIMRICFQLLSIDNIFTGYNPVFNAEIFKMWYENIVKWAHFRNPKEIYKEIRESEAELMKKLASKMASQASIILETFRFKEPFDHIKSFETTNEEVKEILEKALVEQIINRFKCKDGILELWTGKCRYRAEKRILFCMNSLFHNKIVFNQLISIASEASVSRNIHENFCEYVRMLFYAAKDHISDINKDEIIELLNEREFTDIIWKAVTSRHLNLRYIGSLEEKRKFIIKDILKDEKAFPTPEWWERELNDAQDRKCES